jgi:hypothetical protein
LREDNHGIEVDKIRHMTKIWNSGWAVKELGWA